jgi:peptidoglycan L-alanyl-D-glutamate endopeptidase CwlK
MEYEDLMNLLWGGDPPSEMPSSFKEPETNDMPEESIKSSKEIDGNSRSLINSLDERLQPMAIAFLEAARQAGIDLVITQGYRSKSQQSALYEQGRTTPGAVVTNAKPGYSKHNYGVAFDVAPLNKSGNPYWPNDTELWDRIGQIGESIGLKWSGKAKFKDLPHFEYPGVSMKDLLTGVYKNKYTQANNSYYLTKQAERANRKNNLRLLRLKLFS